MASLLILLIESDYESDQDSSGDYGSSEDDDAISKRKRNKKGKSAEPNFDEPYWTSNEDCVGYLIENF